MIGFSIWKFYGILGTTATHNHKSFFTFISNIIDHRTNVLSLEESKFIIVWGNSSIHKSNEAKKYLKNSQFIFLVI